MFHKVKVFATSQLTLHLSVKDRNNVFKYSISPSSLQRCDDLRDMVPFAQF